MNLFHYTFRHLIVLHSNHHSYLTQRENHLSAKPHPLYRFFCTLLNLALIILFIFLLSSKFALPSQRNIENIFGPTSGLSYLELFFRSSCGVRQWNPVLHRILRMLMRSRNGPAKLRKSKPNCAVPSVIRTELSSSNGIHIIRGCSHRLFMERRYGYFLGCPSLNY